MRTTCLLLIAVLGLLAPVAPSAEPGKRHGVAIDAKSYPQATAKEVLASALKAIDDGRFDYLVAYLADPAFVDDRVKRLYGGKFAEQVADTRARLDPATVRQLRKFNKDGKWTIDRASALVELDAVTDRCVRLVARDGRWHLSHRFDPPAKD